MYLKKDKMIYTLHGYLSTGTMNLIKKMLIVDHQKWVVILRCVCIYGSMLCISCYFTLPSLDTDEQVEK